MRWLKMFSYDQAMLIALRVEYYCFSIPSDRGIEPQSPSFLDRNKNEHFGPICFKFNFSLMSQITVKLISAKNIIAMR